MTKREIKRNILNEIGVEYNEKRLDKMDMTWLENALDMFRASNDKENARQFIQQFIKRK